MEEKFYTCKYDRAFKEIMLKESNKDILTIILEKILNVKITDIVINNIERNNGNLNIKRKYFDVLLTTNEGKIELEVNAHNKPYVHPRNMAYICDIYSSHTLLHDTYNEDTKIIQINLSYGLKSKEKSRIYRMQDNDGKLYVTNMYIYDINMEYYKKIWYDKNEEEIEKNKYLIMLDLQKEELNKISENDKVVEKYMKDLEKLNGRVEFREYMTHEEDLRKIRNSEISNARNEGEQIGVSKGKKESAISIAKSMLEEHIDIETIARCTNLSKEDIENL